jgi:hypothetical protein
MHDLDVARRDAKLFGHDLGEGGLVALALGLHRQPRHGLARRVHPQLRAVRHAQTQDVHVLAGTRVDRLGEEGDADAHERRPRPFGRLLLFFSQLLVASEIHGEAQRLHLMRAPHGGVPPSAFRPRYT